MLDFDRTKITEALSGEEARLAVAFATACAQRLANSLGASEKHEEAKSIAVRTLGALRTYLVDGAFLPESLEDQIVSLIPDEDEDPGFQAAVLDDALAALSFAVRASTISPSETACDAAARAVDTAFRYSAQTLNETSLTDSSIRFVMESAIVQCELQRQERDLADIGDGFQQAQTTIGRLLDRSSAEAVLETNI
jgi:hypothetical protein